MLAGAEGQSGLAVDYQTASLPHLVLWKNTAAHSDGYVVGIEPATGWPLTRREEESAGRLVNLDAGQTKSFRVRLRPLLDAAAVNQSQDRIRRQT